MQDVQFACLIPGVQHGSGTHQPIICCYLDGQENLKLCGLHTQCRQKVQKPRSWKRPLQLDHRVRVPGIFRTADSRTAGAVRHVVAVRTVCVLRVLTSSFVCDIGARSELSGAESKKST